MKKLYFVIVVILLGLRVNVVAQNDGGVSIGKGNSDADPSAILELVSTNKGLLIPRLSSSDRQGIGSPANGLIVYDTTYGSFYYWNGIAWKPVSGKNITSGTVYPTSANDNDLFFNTSSNLLYIKVSGGWNVAGAKKQILKLDSTTLKLLEEGENTGSEVDLSALFQNLSLTGTKLTISKGNTVDLSSLSSDNQTMTLTGKVLTISGGNSVDFSTLVGSISASTVKVNTTVELVSTNVQAALEELQTEIIAKGDGDMLKSHFDTNNNGQVDGADNVNGFTVQTSVPQNAVFTDNQQLNINGNTIFLSGQSPSSIILPATMTKGIYDVNSNNIIDQAETALTVSDNAITSEKIADQTIQATDLVNITANGTNGQVLSSNGIGGFSWINATSGGTGDMLKATYDLNSDNIVDIAASVSDNAITSAKIANQTIKDIDLSGITSTGVGGKVLTADGYGGFAWTNLVGGGTVSTVSITPANGISGTVTNPTTTPAISLSLGAITPNSVAANGNISATGSITGSNLSGTNTGDQTISFSGDLSGSGTGAINAQIASDVILESDLKASNTAANGQVLTYNSGTGGFTWANASSGSGDMLKATYDSNSDNIVDIAATVSDNAVTSAKIASDAIQESDLMASNAAVNGQVLTYNSGTGGFTWINASSGSGDMLKATYDSNSDNIVDVAATVSDNAVTSAKIASDAIMESDLMASNAAVNGQVLSYNSGTGGFTWANASSSSGDMLKATYDSNSDNIVDIAATVSDNTVTSAKLAADAVTSAKIASDAIQESDLMVSNAAVNGQVLTYNSGTGGFTWADASSGSGDMLKATYDSNSDNIVDIAATVSNNAITSTKLATDAVTSAKILDATIAPADVNVSGTPSSGDVLTYASSTGFAWATPGSGGALNVTSEQSGNYTVLATDDVILVGGTSQHTLTLPTTGISVGKMFYISNSGTGGVDFAGGTIREPSAQTVNGGVGAIIMFVGSGSYSMLTGW